jgi:hypothetical protein
MNKLVDEAPYQPGYEDAVIIPEKLSQKITQALDRKPMTEDELDRILESLDVYYNTHAGVMQLLRAIEAHHGIK